MADVILKGIDGQDKVYSGASAVKLRTTDGGSQIFSEGEVVEDVYVEPDFSGGDQLISAPAGMLVKSAVLQKPESLIPENIAEGVDIAGVIGTLTGGGGGPSNVCVGTITVGTSGVANGTAVTIVPKKELDAIGFGSAGKRFAILIPLTSGPVLGTATPLILVQTSYRILQTGSSSHSYGYRITARPSGNYNQFTTANISNSDYLLKKTAGYLYYDSTEGLQYYGDSASYMYNRTYMVIAGVVT